MILELRQQFRFEAARRLTSLPEGHPCGRLHGHSFKVILVLQGPRHPKFQWVRDYHEISTVTLDLLKILDHRLLNDVEGLENPTSENICIWLFEKLQLQLAELVQVIVSETPETECRYPVLTAVKIGG